MRCATVETARLPIRLARSFLSQPTVYWSEESRLAERPNDASIISESRRGTLPEKSEMIHNDTMPRGDAVFTTVDGSEAAATFGRQEFTVGEVSRSNFDH